MLGPQDDAGVRTEVLTFRAADQRGCGELTAEDIGEALRLQGLEVPADLQQIWSRVDINQCGKVNLIEFVAATMEPRVFCQPALFKAAFRVLGPPPSAPHQCSTAHPITAAQRTVVHPWLLQAALHTRGGATPIDSLPHSTLKPKPPHPNPHPSPPPPTPTPPLTWTLTPSLTPSRASTPRRCRRRRVDHAG